MISSQPPSKASADRLPAFGCRPSIAVIASSSAKFAMNQRRRASARRSPLAAHTSSRESRKSMSPSVIVRASSSVSATKKSTSAAVSGTRISWRDLTDLPGLRERYVSVTRRASTAAQKEATSCPAQPGTRNVPTMRSRMPPPPRPASMDASSGSLAKRRRARHTIEAVSIGWKDVTSRFGEAAPWQFTPACLWSSCASPSSCSLLMSAWPHCAYEGCSSELTTCSRFRCGRGSSRSKGGKATCRSPGRLAAAVDPEDGTGSLQE
mmetsp:Transcript_59754/g.153911  ORF Transcript_59754/g.153911 Transcript_59754/m.153911 type:complete len:265 (-) Transcript_59754:21-815(-)